MIQSKANRFSVSLIDEENKAYPILKLDGKNEIKSKSYVIGEKSSVFMITVRVNSDVADIDETYGAKLFIDDREIHSNKTFKKTGRFFGFSVGNGVYNQFLFSNPNVSDVESNENTSDRIGNIRIVFYKTKPIISKRNKLKKTPKLNNQITIPIVSSSRNKSLKSLQVNIGREFTNSYTTKQRLQSYNHKELEYDYVCDFTQDIDDVEFEYSDLDFMLAVGYIHLSNIDHAIYLPYRIGVNKKLCIPVIKAIINKHFNDDCKMNIENLHTLFKKYTGHPLTMYYINSSFDEFVTENLSKLIEVEKAPDKTAYSIRAKAKNQGNSMEELRIRSPNTSHITIKDKPSANRSITSLLHEFEIMDQAEVINLN